ncbi:uncharacterized protein LOC133799752 [Humulus lupulus]|uniref:uncharacterized protein LOC133799752 n=1 Tax=Humulus lupulus TaxID=3486 RepID=UPI002B406258|nr:uncharacterized protein LOC133799752 [Humulus lupulus]
MNLARFVTDDEQNLKEDKKDIHVIKTVKDWINDDFFCRNYILNGLENSLYGVIDTTKTATELWESLNWKYTYEDAGAKKFVVGWFQDYKMHKPKQVSIKELIVRLRIEEDNNISNKRSSKQNVAKANLVEQGQNSKGKKNYNPNDKGFKFGPKGGISKMPFKFLSALTATSQVDNGENLFMGNSDTSQIVGQGSVILKMTLGNELILNNVLYVQEIRKNLVSGSLLNKHRFRIVFESDKVVLSKIGIKDEAIEKCVLYKTDVDNQLNKKIKVLRSDRGGEYELPFH